MPFTIGEIPIGNVVDGELVLRDLTISYNGQAPDNFIPPINTTPSRGVPKPKPTPQPMLPPMRKPSPVRGGAGGIVRPGPTTMAMGEESPGGIRPAPAPIQVPEGRKVYVQVIDRAGVT